jgi:hypothetical protein
VKHATLECEHCGAPVTYKSPFCPYCRAKLTWGAHAVLQRGAPIVHADLGRDPIPSEDGRVGEPQKRPDGVLFSPKPAKLHRGHFAHRFRDVCAMVRGVCFEQQGTIGIMARMHKHGRSSAGYEVEIYPGFRSFRFRRVLWVDGELQHVIVHDWEHTPAIGGPGRVNELELRCADSLFQLVVNGELVLSLVEAAFGFGQFGWSCGSESEASGAQVLLMSVSLARVV